MTRSTFLKFCIIVSSSSKHNLLNKNDYNNSPVGTTKSLLKVFKVLPSFLLGLLPLQSLSPVQESPSPPAKFPSLRNRNPCREKKLERTPLDYVMKNSVRLKQTPVETRDRLHYILKKANQTKADFLKVCPFPSVIQGPLIQLALSLLLNDCLFLNSQKAKKKRKCQITKPALGSALIQFPEKHLKVIKDNSFFSFWLRIANIHKKIAFIFLKCQSINKLIDKMSKL